MTPDPLVAALRSALPDALRARDTEAASALRTALSAVANAEAVPGDASDASAATDAEASQHVAGAALGVGAAEVARHELTPDEVRSIVVAEVAERVAAAEVHDGGGQAAYAERLRREAAVLQRVLDATPSA